MAVALASAPTTIDDLIVAIQGEFPGAGISVTGRARTIRRQAELMAQRIRANSGEFLSTYAARPHIIEMDRWVVANPSATLEQATSEVVRSLPVSRFNPQWKIARRLLTKSRSERYRLRIMRNLRHPSLSSVRGLV